MTQHHLRGATLIAVVTLAALTACSQGGGDPTFDTVDDLRDAVVDAGLGCSDFDKESDTQGMCGGSVVLSVLADAAERAEFADIMVTQSLIPGSILSGGNWVLIGPRADLENVQDELGGAIEDTSA